MTDSPAYVELRFFFIYKDKLKPVCLCRNWKNFQVLWLSFKIGGLACWWTVEAFHGKMLI